MCIWPAVASLSLNRKFTELAAPFARGMGSVRKVENLAYFMRFAQAELNKAASEMEREGRGLLLATQQDQQVQG